MDIFKVHDNIIKDYKTYIESFVNIKNDFIRNKVTEEISSGKLWPQPLIQFNPSYKPGCPIIEMVTDDTLHKGMEVIFKDYTLYEHQVEAIKLGSLEKNFIVTSGTGSGKSLTYLGTIFNHILKHIPSKGIKAIIVYPMNALINSQYEEIAKYRNTYEEITKKDFPVTYAQYTGQEDENARKKVWDELPDIILTNYMMLELILTRLGEDSMRSSIYESLKFLVFDELHTYRGRQGSDVALLIRRLKAKCKNDILCIGTSATMISGKSLSNQKAKVAEVASEFFGSSFEPEQVVVESLIPSLSMDRLIDLKAAVIDAVNDYKASSNYHYDDLINNSLAQWLEKEIALRVFDDGTVVRNKPMTFEQIVEALNNYTDLPLEKCSKALEYLLHNIAEINARAELDRHSAILPFKLHQFISQTGSVYMTLDKEDGDKLLTLQAGVYIRKEGEIKKPIYPVVFSRESGHEFICALKNQETKSLMPREFSDWNSSEEEEGESNLAGYLIYGKDIWNGDDLSNLPDSWLTPRRDKVIKKYRSRIPQKIWYNDLGQYSDTKPLSLGNWQEGWFMPYKLLFDPTSGTFYDTKTSEGTKLTKLGSEGRSTSTTILSFSVLRKLAEAGYAEEKQKILSFTDNRQDAALQAGHFNDFIQTLHLRAGINKAVHQSEKGYLEFPEIGNAIFSALGVKQEDYAISVAEFAGPRKDNENALKDFLTYKVLYDLRRSWRVVLPNLEQCGLLKIEYKYLAETITDPNFVKQFSLLAELDEDERFNFIYTTLDFFRKSYAIRSTEFLDENKIEVKKRNIIQKLKYPWRFGDDEKIPEPNFMRYDTVPKQLHKFTQSIGSASGYGRYLKYLVKEKTGESLNKKRYTELIDNLLDLLKRAGWLNAETVALKNGDKTTVYQLNIDQLQWTKVDDSEVLSDPIKTRSYKTNYKPANKFFKSIYQVNFKQLKELKAADHTGQSSKADRQDREKDFRTGKLSALYCSPTMELGIDISSLDIVHMRNVPPNPANYVQRSGRAGRSGQAALVFTYCSVYSPHDRNYFKNAIKMVSGNVVAPRLDLANEELLRTHLHALYLSELGLHEINNSISDIIDEDEPVELPIRETVRTKIENAATTKLKVLTTSVFREAISDIWELLDSDKTKWFNDSWINRVISSFYHDFDASLERWRTLYKAARVQLEEATATIKSGLYKVNSPEYKEAERNQQQATRQLSQLRNKDKRSLSEFYPFRYFASEGFLPGYNFTRLPIRTYLQAHEAGEYISRPRFIALREFGPKNIIYYNGTKFSIEQLILKERLNTVKAKVALKSGYFLDGADFDADTCPLTHTPLNNDNNRKNFINLVEMSETRGIQRDRISCDEEERASQGFEIDTYFSVPAGIHTITKAKVLVDKKLLLNLQYIPSARLVHVNTKWRKSSKESFKIGVRSGLWRSHAFEPKSSDSETLKEVQLYTWDTADALYIQPVKALGLNYEGIITLMYALKRAIELEFQVEPREIGVSQMGDADNPNIFIYESSEGSLGILSQIVEQADLFSRLINKAIEVCRFDEKDYTAPASYDDLLNYYNQRHHLDIDRFLIKDKLDVLRNCEIELQSGINREDYDEHYQMLLRRIDKSSQTELQFLEYLHKHNLQLPDTAQEKHKDIYVMPDFYYRKQRAWIFCDGTPHDRADIKERDKRQREAIIAKGEEVWVYYYKENLDEKIKKRPDLFKKIR